MFLRFEENPNCGFVEDRVWKEQGIARPVRQVLRRRQERDVWCPVVGIDREMAVVDAMAIKVEDSGEGLCWLVFGGLWGVRLFDPGNLPGETVPRVRVEFQEPKTSIAWSLSASSQWGEGFLLLPADGADLYFEP